jgi:hypothetical protein
MYKVLGTDNQIYGPVTAELLRQWIAEGRVNHATLLQPEGATDWKPLSAFPEFAVSPPPGGIPPPVSLPTQKEQGTEHNMALAGLILGILSIVGCCFAFPCGILGVVLSLVALCRERPPGHSDSSDKNIALAGLILSIIGLMWHGLIVGLLGGGALIRHHRWRW